MKSILVLFNGIKFPYYLMEYSLNLAKKEGASLYALFLKGKDDPSDGYGFPSDLAQAETLTDEEDARKDDEKIIGHNVKLVRDMAGTENISVTTEIRTDSSLSEILEVIESFDMVCIDAAYDDDTPSMLTNNRFSSQELIEKAPATLKLISEDSIQSAID